MIYGQQPIAATSRAELTLARSTITQLTFGLITSPRGLTARQRVRPLPRSPAAARSSRGTAPSRVASR